MSDARASETLAYRVLEQWCLVGDEPMEGEQWEKMCSEAGVNPAKTASGAEILREQLTFAERKARLRELNHQRQIAFGQEQDDIPTRVLPGRQRHTWGYGAWASHHSADQYEML